LQGGAGGTPTAPACLLSEIRPDNTYQSSDCLKTSFCERIIWMADFGKNEIKDDVRRLISLFVAQYAENKSYIYRKYCGE